MRRSKQYYTELVDHYFRMGVRYLKVKGEVSKKWFAITTKWIEKQSEEDKNLIRFVFSYQFDNAIEGIYCFRSDENMYQKRQRLADLEKNFAISSGLISENEKEERW